MDEISWEGEVAVAGSIDSAPPLLDYQQAALDHIGSWRGSGRSLLAVAPPGSGKSRIMEELAAAEVGRGGKALIKVHRQMLLEQMYRGFKSRGHHVGVIAAGWPADDTAGIQLASSHTLVARAVNRSVIELPDVSLVMNDEAHQQASNSERAMMFGSRTNQGMIQHGYLSRGVDVIGFTATPCMEQRIYSDMHQITTYSELRKKGMHLPIAVYGPEEIDSSKLKPNKNGDISDAQLEKRVNTIWGSVWNEWYKLNPDALPTILFAPGVDSSLWFAQTWMRKGLPAAHIDSHRIYLPNSSGMLTSYQVSKAAREDLLAMSKDGRIKIVCNRFVLREGIDMPWLYHGIFATIMGSISTALQSIGRLQRYYEPYASYGRGVKIMQDHGGFYWRHGSPNEDRAWILGDTNRSYAQLRDRKVRAKQKSEGICCPRCSHWRTRGSHCPGCNHTHMQSTRSIRMLGGRLKKVEGQVRKPEKQWNSDSEKIWMGCLFGAARTDKTCGQAVALAISKAEKSGIRMKWDVVPHPPPKRDTTDWHVSVNRFYPWLGRWSMKFRKGNRGKS